MKCMICKISHSKADLLRVDRGSLSGEWACEEHIDEADAQQRVAKATEAAARENNLGAGNAIPA